MMNAMKRTLLFIPFFSLSFALLLASLQRCRPTELKKQESAQLISDEKYLSFEDAFMVPPLTAFGKTIVEMLEAYCKK